MKNFVVLLSLVILFFHYDEIVFASENDIIINYIDPKLEISEISIEENPSTEDHNSSNYKNLIAHHLGGYSLINIIFWIILELALIIIFIAFFILLLKF